MSIEAEILALEQKRCAAMTARTGIEIDVNGQRKSLRLRYVRVASARLAV
ncbi:MAG: hypothetical protein ACREVC_04595 [Burkholderiales bacterium]